MSTRTIVSLATAALLAALSTAHAQTGTPDQIRAFVRNVKADGADLVKLFASKSSREGGGQTMTDAQIQAACAEAKAVGLRSWVHAHSPSSVRAATLAGCTTVTHGSQATDVELKLMQQHGTYFGRTSVWCRRTISRTRAIISASATSTTRGLPSRRS
jgi:imidazolonepropionase-like amidohydrolase